MSGRGSGGRDERPGRWEAARPSRWLTRLLRAVAERSREIGIRRALGASSGSIAAAILGRGLILTLAGMAAGMTGAAYLTRFIQSRLFGVGSLDGVTYAAGAVLLIVVATFASWIPVRRALGVAPVRALKQDA